MEGNVSSSWSRNLNLLFLFFSFHRSVQSTPLKSPHTIHTMKGAAKKKTTKNVDPALAKRRGAKCHFVGEQWDFLAAAAPSFGIAKDHKTQGAFYRMMGRKFVVEWGLPKISAGDEDEDDEDDDDDDEEDDATTTTTADSAQIIDPDNAIDPALRGTTSEAAADASSKEFNAFVKVNSLILCFPLLLIVRTFRKLASSIGTILEGQH